MGNGDVYCATVVQLKWSGFLLAKEAFQTVPQTFLDGLAGVNVYDGTAL